MALLPPSLLRFWALAPILQARNFAPPVVPTTKHFRGDRRGGSGAEHSQLSSPRKREPIRLSSDYGSRLSLRSARDDSGEGRGNSSLAPVSLAGAGVRP